MHTHTVSVCCMVDRNSRVPGSELDVLPAPACWWHRVFAFVQHEHTSRFGGGFWVTAVHLVTVFRPCDMWCASDMYVVIQCVASLVQRHCKTHAFVSFFCVCLLDPFYSIRFFYLLIAFFFPLFSPQIAAQHGGAVEGLSDRFMKCVPGLVRPCSCIVTGLALLNAVKV